MGADYHPLDKVGDLTELTDRPYAFKPVGMAASEGDARSARTAVMGARQSPGDEGAKRSCLRCRPDLERFAHELGVRGLIAVLPLGPRPSLNRVENELVVKVDEQSSEKAIEPVHGDCRRQVDARKSDAELAVLLDVAVRDPAPAPSAVPDVRGHVWVTRRKPHLDLDRLEPSGPRIDINESMCDSAVCPGQDQVLKAWEDLAKKSPVCFPAPPARIIWNMA
jgi:hypothetical protein